MPPTQAPVLRAADLRLVHACVKIARVTLCRALQDQDDLGPLALKAREAIQQAEAVVQAEMTKHNLVPALSAQELRDEALADEDLPLF